MTNSTAVPSIPLAEPTFALIVTCKYGHTVQLTREESEYAIEHQIEGVSYMTSERAYLEWTCEAEGCVDRPWQERRNSIRL